MSAIAHEWRVVSRERLFRFAAVSMLLFTSLALWTGFAFKTARDSQAVDEVARSIDKRVSDRAAVEAEEAGLRPRNPWGPSSPVRADWNATRPSGPLAMLSFGREDIQPQSSTISLWFVRPDNLFRKYEFGSPLVLSAGRFDAGFLVVLLMPLFVLALTYSLAGEERESGRMRLAVVMQSDFPRRLSIRAALRLAPVILCVAAMGVAAWLAGAPGLRVLVWTVGGMLYLAMWGGIGLGHSTLRARQEVLALSAAGLWLLVAVLLPALLVGGSRLAAPESSPFELINQTREATVQANRALMDNLVGYVGDHPELMEGDPTEDDWAAKLYVSQIVVSEAVAPTLEAARLREEARERWIRALRFLSPTMLVDDLMIEVAGTGPARQRAFTEQVQAFLKGWREALSPKLFRRQSLTPQDIEALPSFEFREPPLATATVLIGLGYLAAFCFAAAIWARRRLRALAP